MELLGILAAPMSRSRKTITTVVALLLNVLFTALAQSEPRPNIVIVSIDTLRADRCSAYGYRRETTPNLERLAQEGTLFENAYAPMGQTGPSHATLFTGLYPTAHGVIKNGRVLPDAQNTLAERLTELGYDTAAFVSSFPLERRFGLQQGFATYDDEFLHGQGSVDIRTWEGETPKKAFDRKGNFTLARALSWLDGRRTDSTPFFLFVHLFDPHSPYKPPQKVLEQVLGDERPRDHLKVTHLLYDGEVRFADSIVGKLLESLDALGATDNTVTVVTSDHGEGLMQRGFLTHGLFVYEEEVRVPLIVRWPTRIAAGRSVGAPITLADITPTLLGLLECDMAADTFQGIDLAAHLLAGKSIPANRPIFFMRPRFPKSTIASGWSGKLANGQPPPRLLVDGAKYGVRLDIWKYIVSPSEGTTELYNLQADPNELADIADRHESIAKVMHGHINKWLADAPSESTAKELLDDETREALEALGYTN